MHREITTQLETIGKYETWTQSLGISSIPFASCSKMIGPYTPINNAHVISCFLSGAGLVLELTAGQLQEPEPESTLFTILKVERLNHSMGTQTIV